MDILERQRASFAQARDKPALAHHLDPESGRRHFGDNEELLDMIEELAIGRSGEDGDCLIHGFERVMR